jgi:hypothetical protein
MAINEGMRVIDAVLNKHGWDMDKLREAARARILAMPGAPGLPTGIPFGLAPCATCYGANAAETSNEMLAWCLGLMLAEWLAGLLVQKVEEGHCRQHRVAPRFDPCPTMAAEHKRMLEKFAEAVRSLEKDIDSKVASLRMPVPPGP